MIIDPHSAVGVAAARRALAHDPATPVIALGTAHPAKFPDAVERATGVRPALPPISPISWSARRRSSRPAQRRGGGRPITCARPREAPA